MDGFKKNWYREWFGEDYLTVYKHRNSGDAKALIGLIRANVPLDYYMRVLDLGCGNGRHAFALLPHVQKIFGLDLSEHLLRVAVKQKTDNVLKSWPAFIRGDMRHLPFKQPFDLILSLFTSFGYFDNDEQHEDVAIGMVKMMKEGGYLVLDYLNAGYVTEHLKAKGKRQVEDMEVDELRWIDNGRVYKKISLHQNDEQRIFYESVRLFSFDELSLLLRKAGIKIINTYGNYLGDAYSVDTPRMIFIGIKD